MIRIFIADDHPIVRKGIRDLIEQDPELCIVGEASDGRATLNAPGRENWDLLILDLSLPKVSGTEVLRRLREELPNLRIVILSMYPEDQYGLRLVQLGASAYLSKELDPVELLRAIRVVAAGGTYLTRNIAEQMRRGSSAPPESPPHASLSAREHQVFTLLFQGRGVSDIAAELNLSVSTVSNHVAKVKEKLNAKTIGEIVAYAHRAGLVG
ncbi:MAG: response regulator transcription factor [Polyangiaceae bacterium]|nr:response regulator transcription factor [Polyangiaceae bacterium]